MLVTITPSPERVGRNHDKSVVSPTELFKELAYIAHRTSVQGCFSPTSSRKPADEPKTIPPIFYHSFPDLTSDDASTRVISQLNGFVDGIIRAYQQDLHLSLRPDDVWQAIITQFSFYVAGHAEELRSKFVAHDGTVNLVLERAG